MSHQSQLFDEDEPGILVPNVFVQETSKEAYKEIVNNPVELNGRYREYLDALEGVGHPATDQEVSRFAGHSDPNYFRPRRNELVKMGLVVESGKRVCAVSGKTALVWWVVE